MSIPVSGGPKSLRPKMPEPQEMDAKLREAAKAQEKLFLSTMMKAMRGTVQESEFMKKSSAEKIFQEQLDGEYLQSWSEQGGVGFAQIIYENLKEKYGAQLGLTAPGQKLQGPVPLEQEKLFQLPKITPSENGVQLNFSRVESPMDSSQKAAVALQVPWDANYLGSYQLDSGLNVMEFGHSSGLKSQMIFKGFAKDLPAGSEIKQGVLVGSLSPDANSFFLNLKGPSRPDFTE